MTFKKKNIETRPVVIKFLVSVNVLIAELSRTAEV